MLRQLQRLEAIQRRERGGRLPELPDEALGSRHAQYKFYAYVRPENFGRRLEPGPYRQRDCCTRRALLPKGRAMKSILKKRSMEPVGGRSRDFPKLGNSAKQA